MAQLNIPQPKEGRNDRETINNLITAYHILRKQLDYFTKYIDSENVTEINTNITTVKSNQGTTVINGPLLVMYDKQAVPVLRLKMGYDAASLGFVFQLMNAAGDITVNIDSNGDLTVERGTFKGSITIGTGNNVFKADSNGIYLGNAVYASAPFRVSMAGAATATNLVVIGGVIKGSQFRNADESMEMSFSGSEFRVLNVGSSTTIFSVSETLGTTDISADGAAVNMSITGDSVVAWGNWKFNGTNWGVFNIATTRQTASLLGAKSTTETAGATYTANEQSMLSNLKADVQSLYAKVDEMLNKLAAYGIFEIV